MKHFSVLIFMLASLMFSAAAWSQSASMDSDAEPININTASEEELAAMLKNVGMHKASAIVKYRNIHGPFKSVDELSKVSGIGPITIEMNRARMTVYGTERENQPSPSQRLPGQRMPDSADVANYDDDG